jgi:D-tyrosyl-tRNA(Tyr) deacylase
MKLVIQRVSEASVSVDEQNVGAIDVGLLVLVGFAEGDQRGDIEQMVQKLIDFRVFPDDDGQMNRSLQEVQGDLLLVPNFTLCSETDTGNRPGFGPAASPGRAEELFEDMIQIADERAPAAVETGEFGAMMDVELTNDGPVTFVL